MVGVLRGLKVLDLTFYLPGPYATLFLADLGAEVIKVENPAGGDPLRGLGPLSPEGGPSAGSVLFQACNRGKRSLTLDLKSPEGRALFLRLAAGADAVIEQFRPGVAARLGVGYEDVRAVNPSITYVSLTGYGQTGPLAGEAGHDLNYMARSGLLSLFLDDGRNGNGGGQQSQDVDRSRLPPIQFADLFGGCLAAAALLAGMLAARLPPPPDEGDGPAGGCRGGAVDAPTSGAVDAPTSGAADGPTSGVPAAPPGRHLHLDVSMTDGLFSLLTVTAANHLAAGGQPPRRSNLFLAGGEPFYNVYRTADGKFLSVGALEPRFWSNVCAVLAESDPERKGAAVIGASTAEVARVFATRPAAEWLDRFAGLDVCVAPVLTVEEALGSEPARARDAVIEVAGSRQIGPPIKTAGGRTFRPAPRLGQDNRAILLSLGLDETDIADLAARGVISRPVSEPDF